MDSRHSWKEPEMVCVLASLFPPQCGLTQALGRTEPREGALTDPAVESGKGRGRGSKGGLMRNICCLPTVHMDTSIWRPAYQHTVYFIFGKTHVYFIYSSSVQTSHKSSQDEGKPAVLLLAPHTVFFPGAGVHAVLVSLGGMRFSWAVNPDSNQTTSLPRYVVLPCLSPFPLELETGKTLFSQ